MRMPNVTVYLPDDLHGRWRELKDSGEEINLSRLLQRILTGELRARELKAMRLPAIEGSVDVRALAKQFHERRQQLFRIGWEMALEWTNRATALELEYMGEAQEDPNGDMVRVDIENETYWVPDARMAVFSEEVQWAHDSAREKEIPFDPQPVRDGFFASLETVWAQIVEQANTGEGGLPLRTFTSDRPPVPDVPKLVAHERSSSSGDQAPRDDDIPF